jgi:hypothetical protein
LRSLDKFFQNTRGRKKIYFPLKFAKSLNRSYTLWIKGQRFDLPGGEKIMKNGMLFSGRQCVKTLAAAIVFFGISATSNASTYKTGEVLVKYKDGAFRISSMMNNFYDSTGVSEVQYFDGAMKNFEHLILRDDVDVLTAIQLLEKDPMVEYAQPNYLMSLPVEGKLAQAPMPGIPCIPGFDIPGCDKNAPIPCIMPGVPFPPGCTDSGGGTPGNPGNPGTRPDLKDAPVAVDPPVVDPDLSKAWGIAKVNAPDGWKVNRGSQKIVVAVIDTGIDYNHKDLAFNVWRNPNPTNNDVAGFDFVHNDGLPFDDQGHGTHTAGTVGAVGGNGVGISGVTQLVSVMGVKFITSRGTGDTASAIKAIDYAVKNGAKILSNSWGGKGDNNKALYNSIEAAKNAGVIFVAAAGNDGTDNDQPNPVYPASFDNENIVAVAATDEKDAIAFFSNYGPKTTDVAAPGVNIYSLAPGDGYASHSGTSMACPHVAGALALIWAKKPNMTADEVKKALYQTVDPVPDLATKVGTGGRINVLKALNAI